MAKLTREEFEEVRRLQEEREAQRRERIRQAVAASDVPLSPELAKAVIKLNNKYARAILRGHPGYQLAERRDSYLTSLAIMEQCLQDLLAAICSFETAVLTERSKLLYQAGEAELNGYERRIQKELFACANAAASLVDHARRVDKCHNLLEYETQRIACFGTDGLHEFVIALRVMLHHLHMVKTDWLVTFSFSEGTKTATFVITKEVVQGLIAASPERFGREADEAVRAYVNAAPENIDLRAIFLEYRARMARFHAWMKQELESDSLIALRDYDHLIKEKVKFDQRMVWKAMIGTWLNWKSPPDPHKHLASYLTSEQLEAVYKLPHNSKEQVDLIISYIDKENAIDDDLRNQAYVLFERSPSNEPTPSD